MYKVLTKKLWPPYGSMAKIMLIMRLTTIILIAAIMQVSAGSFAQKVTLQEKNSPLVRVLEQISDQTGYDFMFSTTTLKDAKNVTISVRNAELKDVLVKIFENQPLEYEINAKAVVVSKKEPGFLEKVVARFQSIDVHGRVVDEKGQPMSGVTIKLKDNSQSTSSDKDGQFWLRKVDGKAVFVISYVGYLNRELDVSPEMGNITLKISNSKLDEVIIQAYGTTSKRLTTSNIATVKGEDIAKSPVTNVLFALEGRVPGLFINQTAHFTKSDPIISVQSGRQLDCRVSYKSSFPFERR